jgi:murein DD-endopeptidase MepM/ murein hydrolase activator NlpD
MSTKARLQAILSVLTLCTFVVPSLLTNQLYAATKEELEADRKLLTDKINTLDKEIKEFTKKISETQGEAKTLRQVLERLLERRKVLLLEIERTNTQIASTKGRIRDTEFEIASTTSKIEYHREQLAQTLRSISNANYSIPPIVKLLSPSSRLSDFLDDLRKTREVSHAIEDQIGSLHDLSETLTTTKIQFEDNKKVLENLSSTLIDQQLLVDQSKLETDKLLAETKNKEAEYQKLVADKIKKKTAIESEISDVEAKIKTIVDASKIPKYGKGILTFPVDKVAITQYFGNTPFASKNPQVYNGSGHNGIDLGVPIGTAIYTAAPGTVIGTGDTDKSCNGVSYGRWVLVRHSNGLTTLYAHLSVIQVSQGQTLGARQKIGLSGNTGYSTGPHLHFTVYASEAVAVQSYTSKVCGTLMTMPIAPRNAYLNPLSYL